MKWVNLRKSIACNRLYYALMPLAFFLGYFAKEALGEKRAVEETKTGAQFSNVMEPGIKDGSEYVLSFEPKPLRELLESRLEKAVQGAAKKQGPFYSEHFISTGVSLEESERIKSFAWKLQKASMEHEAYQQQLLKARKDFDKYVRKALTPEQYIAYREFETTKVYEAEYERFSAYTTKHNYSDFSSYREEIKGVMMKAGGATMSLSHGPYDEMAQIKTGREAVMREAANSLERMKACQLSLGDAAKGSALPAECVEALKGYYRRNIESLEAGMERSRISAMNTSAPRLQMREIKP